MGDCGAGAAAALQVLYASSRLYTNFFQSSLKLKSKTREPTQSKTRHVIDTEFTDWRDSRLISIAIMSEDGKGVYGSVLHYLQSIKAAGTDEPSAVMAKFRELPIHDAFSENAHLRPDGLVQRDMLLAQIKTPAESKGAWDYYNIVSTIPGKDLVWPLSESKCALVKK